MLINLSHEQIIEKFRLAGRFAFSRRLRDAFAECQAASSAGRTPVRARTAEAVASPKLRTHHYQRKRSARARPERFPRQRTNRTHGAGRVHHPLRQAGTALRRREASFQSLGQESLRAEQRRIGESSHSGSQRKLRASTCWGHMVRLDRSVCAVLGAVAPARASCSERDSPRY